MLRDREKGDFSGRQIDLLALASKFGFKVPKAISSTWDIAVLMHRQHAGAGCAAAQCLGGSLASRIQMNLIYYRTSGPFNDTNDL